MKEKIIGIDLGTTNSCVAIDGKVIFNKNGDNTTPSIVAFKGNDGSERIVGQSAKNQALSNAENTFRGTKRFIGRKYSEMSKDILSMASYKIIKTTNDDIKFQTKQGKDLTSVEISAAILQEMKSIAEQYLNEQVQKAVITVPAYFNDAQRQATKDAGAIAGLDVVRIINEPTAAALAYGVDKNFNGNIAVYDLGGGTFDISILNVTDGVFEVLSTNGDTALGGEDLDEAIMKFLLGEIKKQANEDFSTNKVVLQRLKEMAENAKKTLSTAMSAEIMIPFLTANFSFQYTMTRSQLESLTRSLIDRTVNPCKKAIEDSKLSTNEIQKVILVGGMTRMPLVREVVKQVFGKEPESSINPDECVAVGASIQGSVLAGDRTDLLLLDVTPLSLGIETLGGIMSALIVKNTTIPTKKSQVFSTAEDNQTAVTIRVFQGDRQIAEHNKYLGAFTLHGIAPAKRGVPQIEVTFEMDANGMLNVTAKDLGTGKQQNITIQHSSATSKEDIERMKAEAEQYAEEDRKKAELIEIKNKSENLVYNAESTMKESNATEEIKTSIEVKINNLKTLLGSSNDAEEIQKAHDELMEQMGQLYSQQQNNNNNTEQQQNSEETQQSDNNQ